MKSVFKVGDEKSLNFIIRESDTPTFITGTVHQVYSTFALVRDAEWTTRQFVLEMREEDEEGIGTMVSAVHQNAALVGEEVTITGKIIELRNHEIICDYKARVGNRLIATGQTGQKILKREKFEQLFSALKNKT